MQRARGGGTRDSRPPRSLARFEDQIFDDEVLGTVTLKNYQASTQVGELICLLTGRPNRQRIKNSTFL